MEKKNLTIRSAVRFKELHLHTAPAFQQPVLPQKENLLCYMNDRILLPNCLDLFTFSLHSSKGNRMTDLDIWRNSDCKLNIIKKVFWNRQLNCIDTFLFTYSCHSLITCCLILLVEESYVGKQHILLQWWEASSSLVSVKLCPHKANIL